jgi:hypothetical protein
MRLPSSGADLVPARERVNRAYVQRCVLRRARTLQDLSRAHRGGALYAGRRLTLTGSPVGGEYDSTGGSGLK